VDDAEVRPVFPRRLRRAELIAADTAAAVGYTLFLLSELPRVPPSWPMWLAIAGAGLPVAVRRVWPVPAFGAALAGSVLGMAVDAVHDPLLAAAFVLYLVATTVRRPVWEPTLAIGTLSLLGIFVVTAIGPLGGPGTRQIPAGVGAALVGYVFLGGAWTIGRAVRERRASAARAARQLAERAAVEERLRIARELHDVVSHTLSLIGVKAAVANHVADAQPAEARDALRIIEATSRDAMTEMHRLLGVLRAPAELAPPPDLAGLPALARRASMAGVQVDLDVRPAGELPPGVQLSVYRIVQEAVTNVVKHAAPARCRVLVDSTVDGVRVEVTDDGPAVSRPPVPGHGLIGMRERVGMHGGTFSAGPHPTGGFAVAAVLPARAGGPVPAVAGSG
jgi:signal transduction histidine kinase